LNKNQFEAARSFLYYLVIISSILLFVYSGVYRSLGLLGSNSVKTDFFHWYTAGKIWNEGRHPYDYEMYRDRYERTVQGKQLRERSGFYYPPQTTFLFSLFSRFSLQNAFEQIQIFNLIFLLVSFAMLAHILSWYRTIRLPEITLLVSFLATSYARLNFREGQMGPLLAVLALGTFILTRSKKDVLAGLALGAMSLKPTFIPLYAGYYLLRRSYRLVIIGGLAAILFTVIPLLLQERSISGTLAAWTQSLSRQGVAGNVDDPSPLNPNSSMMSHLEPLIFRILNARSPLSTAIVWLTVLALTGFVTYLLWHKPAVSPNKEELLDFGLVSALSMIAIYHRPYDSFLLFPGLLYVYLHARDSADRAVRWRWKLFIVTITLLLIVPVNTPLRLIGMYPDLVDYYLWRVMAPFQAWISVIVFGVLLWLKIKQPLAKEQQVSSLPTEKAHLMKI
jgi:hypothetical protein